MKYTSADLITAIKRNSSFPSSQVRFSNDDFLYFLNEELQLTIVGELLALRQDYFVTTIDTSLVASQSTYDIPTSAVGWKLEAVGYVDTTGSYSPIPLITRDQRGSYAGLTDGTSPSAVYVMGNTLYTVPDLGSSATGTLRFDLVRIQNQLVMPSTCGKITTVTDDGTDYAMTVDAMPISNGDSCDVISGTNPFNIIARGVTAAVSGSVVTVTYGSDFARVPVANDYVCIAGQTPYPNIPEDFHPILAQSAVMRCLASINDQKGMGTQGPVLANMIDKMRKRASKRIADSPKKVVGNHYVLNMMRRSSYY